MKTKDEVLYAVEDFTEFLSYDKDIDRGRFLNILNKFEKEIRADQDKITRHDCADMVQELEPECAECSGVFQGTVSTAIMNTTSIKEAE